MKSICSIALLLLASTVLAQEWTAYVPYDSSTTCSGPEVTGRFYGLSLATDSQGRVWQLNGNSHCKQGPPPSFLRYFDRNLRNWTIAWNASDSQGPTSQGDHLTWIDKDDNIYIYGGGNDASNALNGFWKFSPKTRTWIELTVGNGSLSTVKRGVEDATNYPGGKRGSAYWYTPDDNSLWLFAGVNDGEELYYGPGFADLWRFNITSQKWTFMAGLLGQISSDDFTPTDAFEVTPFQRWGAISAVDADNNLWLYGGEMMNDLWMFNRSSGWQYISGNNSAISGPFESCPVPYPEEVAEGVFSSQHHPECSAYSSMTYAGNNIMALWSSYTYSNSVVKLWLYNITSKEWAYKIYNSMTTTEVLYVPDTSTSPGHTYSPRVNSPHSLWVVSDESYGVFVMDFPQCTQGVNPCSEHATCTENIARVLPTCTCNEGYEGDGLTCNAVPPTSAGAPSTSSTTPSVTPHNTPKTSTSAPIVTSYILLLFTSLVILTLY